MAAETKKTRKKNKVSEFIDNIRTYFGEVRTELNKVSWPDRDDVVRLTRIVLMVTVASSLVLGALSIFFGLLIEYGITWPLIFLAIFVIIIGATIYMFRRDAQKVGY